MNGAKHQREPRRLAAHTARFVVDKLHHAFIRINSWRWGVIITTSAAIVAAGATVVYTVFADRQWHAMRDQWYVMRDQWDVMRGQLHEMQAEQRPWISLTKDSGIERIYIDHVNGRLAVTLRFGLINTGRDPATDVYVNAATSIGEWLPDRSMAAWQNSVCHQLNGTPIGLTMFPGSLQPTYDITIEHRVPGLIRGRDVTPNTIVAPTFAACIVYRDAVSGALHYTPIGFQVYTLSPKTRKPCCAISLRALPLEANKLVTRQWTFGNLPPT